MHHPLFSGKLPIALVVSVLVHGLIVFSGWQESTEISLSTPLAGTAVFQVSLVNAQTNTNKAVDTHKPTKILQKSVEGANVSKPMPGNNSEIALVQTTARQSTNDPGVENISHSAPNVANDMIKYLETEFRTRFKYPMVARKRGWQGKVVVGVDVNKAGLIHNVNIKQSSGYAVLDNNAIRTFEDIGDIIPALSKGNSRSYQFTIPVIYQLTKG